MSGKWAIRMALDGDLRFISHHDTMRAVERTAARADLPLRYSQGFNPHPVMSLPSPRPTGLATRDDLLVIALDEPMTGDEIVARLNAAAPQGMRFSNASPVSSKDDIRPRRVRYELALEDARARDVQRRLDQLAGQDAWNIERITTDKQGRSETTRTIDLRPMIADLRVEKSTLRWTALSQGDMLARPGELLRLLGLDERIDLAATVRTSVETNT